MNPSLVSLSHVFLGPPSRPVLEDISLTLEAGHFMGIVGPNGAGKSTLLSVIAGLMPPDRGHVDLFGECLRPFNRRRLLNRVGVLPQFHDHPPAMPVRVRDVVAMGLPEYVAPWRWRASRRRVMAALEMVDASALAERDYRELSGGQRQRVRLARALVLDPQLLLLDEPSAALDAARQSALFRLLRRLCDERGMGVIMVEHDIAAISAHVDSVACLNRRIHHHARRGERIPEDVWRAMYGEHMQIMAHDAECIGCVERSAA
ncbi:MAG: ATP-binding cassette domain-containing protein [Mariprofundaceae bacterium]